jgi:hypothetical protein
MARESQVMRSTVERRDGQLKFGAELEREDKCTAVVATEQTRRRRSRYWSWREAEHGVEIDRCLLVGRVGGLLGEDEQVGAEKGDEFLVGRFVL